jgi:mannose-6-phosphate isomerase-like protein (cupin superfamily)
MPTVVAAADLPLLIPGRHLLEGHRFGLQNLTLVLGESAPGQAVPLHRHDYEEMFIVHSGRGTYTVGDTTVEAGPGDVVLIPSGVPHKFANHSQETLYHTAVHATGRLVVEQLEGSTSERR